MPELPDVESFRNYFDATSLHQKIKDAEVRNRKILKNISAGRLKRELKGKSFQSTSRHGKYLFAKINTNLWLMLHFGMTGYLKYFKDIQKDEPHDRLLISFNNGFHLAYVCQRLLGKVTLLQSIDDFIQDNKVGPDALDMDFKTFKNAVAGSRGAVKSTLMNQKRIAGIGNIYADEILFQSGTHPKLPANTLSDKKIKQIYQNMKKVLKKTIQKQANPDRFPRSYLIPHREKRGKCPRCNSIIENTKVAGRTAYFCPHCQSEKS
jgi:formamidopyrimidine-DNA glycosylase